MTDFSLQIITPTEKFFDDRIEWVEYNTTDGYVGVLPGHVPTVQIIAKGELVIHTIDGRVKKANAETGFSRIMPDLVTILAGKISWADYPEEEQVDPNTLRKTETENADFYKMEAELRKTLGELTK